MHRVSSSVCPARRLRSALYSLLLTFSLLISIPNNAHAGIEQLLRGRFASLFFTEHRTGMMMVDEFVGMRGLSRGTTAHETFEIFSRELLAATDVETIAMRRGLEQRLQTADELYEAQRAASREMGPAERELLEREVMIRLVTRQFGADAAAARAAAAQEIGGAAPFNFAAQVRPSIWQSIRSRFARPPAAPGMEAPAPPNQPAVQALPALNESRFTRFMRQGFNSSAMESCLANMNPQMLDRFNQSTYFAEMARTVGFTSAGFALTHGVTNFESFINLMMEVGINGFLTHRSQRFVTRGNMVQPVSVYWTRSLHYSFREQMPVDIIAYTVRHHDNDRLFTDLAEREGYNAAWAFLNPASPAKSVLNRYFLGMFCMTGGMRGAAAAGAWRIAISGASTLTYFGVRHALGAD